MGDSFGVQRHYMVRPRSRPYETLGLRPKIAVFLGDRWALPDLPGIRSLICLHIWKVLGIRPDICERQCATPNALSGRSGQSWYFKSSENGVLRHPNLWNMPTLETPGRQSIQALFMLLLALLSWALALLKTSMGPMMVMTVVCKVENWVKGKKDFNYCAR